MAAVLSAPRLEMLAPPQSLPVEVLPPSSPGLHRAQNRSPAAVGFRVQVRAVLFLFGAIGDRSYPIFTGQNKMMN